MCLPKLVPAFAPGAPLNRKLAPACVLFDSGPTDFTVESGMAAAELTRAQGRHNAFTYHVVSSAGRLSEWLVGEKKRAELRRGLASPLLALPQLYLPLESRPRRSTRVGRRGGGGAEGDWEGSGHPLLEGLESCPPLSGPSPRVRG